MTESPAAVLANNIATWHQATADFVALARSIPEDQWSTPTDLEGWNVKDIVAHSAHLEAVIAGGPEETVDVGEPPHVKGLMGLYTEQGVVARKDRSMEELCHEIEVSSRKTHETLAANPPTDPAADSPIPTPGGVPWNTGTVLSNRPLDLWTHEQDIRRAIGLPGGYGSLAATHTIDVMGRGLGVVIGKRVHPPEGTIVQIDLPEADRSWRLAVREGRAVPDDSEAEPTVRLEFSAEDFVVLTGGRRLVEQTDVRIEGDQDLGRQILANLTLTP